MRRSPRSFRSAPTKPPQLLDTAGREIAEQVATSVLIIEDEPIIALDIESMVRELGHEVTGVARTHREAVDMVKARPPGLVLADIQLADGSSGLEAVNEILTTLGHAGHFHHRLPRAPVDRREAGAGVPRDQAVPARRRSRRRSARRLFFDRKAGRKIGVERLASTSAARLGAEPRGLPQPPAREPVPPRRRGTSRS